MEKLRTVIKKLHVQNKVKLFINKLKRNKFTNKARLEIEQS